MIVLRNGGVAAAKRSGDSLKLIFDQMHEGNKTNRACDLWPGFFFQLPTADGVSRRPEIPHFVVRLLNAREKAAGASLPNSKESSSHCAARFLEKRKKRFQAVAIFHGDDIVSPTWRRWNARGRNPRSGSNIAARSASRQPEQLGVEVCRQII